MKYSVSKIFLLVAIPFWAVSQDGDTTRAEADTVRNRFIPTGLRVGVDAISIIKSRTQNDFAGWEVNADIDFYRYYLSLDYGEWSRHFSSSSGVYDNSGTYWRVGPDVNFLTRDPDRNMFFLGWRYGRSVFSEDYSITVSDPVWGPVNEHFANTDISARWLELTGGVRVKIWKFIWMGYTGRFKFGLKTDPTDALIPHDVPGFGNTNKKTTWGFNYQVLIRIPFRKMPPLPPADE